MSGPFKMKNQDLATSAKYKTPINYNSPAKNLDVLIDGENIGTGNKAYAKGRVQEIKSKKAVEGAYSSSPGTTEESKKADETRVTDATSKIKTVEYTGDDAYKRINDSEMSAKEKSEAKAKVRDGGSYKA
jgi:hypothetical protein